MFLIFLAFFSVVCYNTLMDKKNNTSNQKLFPYRLTPVLITLCVLVLLLSCAGIAVSVYRLILRGSLDFKIGEMLKSPFFNLRLFVLYPFNRFVAHQIAIYSYGKRTDYAIRVYQK